MSREDNKGNKFRRDPTTESQLRRERRRQRAIERLGTNDPKCIYCGENDPLVLERHHVAGQALDHATIIVCRNHHRKLSDRQKDHPNKSAEIPETSEIVAHFLLGLADLFEFLIEKFREMATQLLSRVDPNRDNIPGPQS
jgi:hypothetical protein